MASCVNCKWAEWEMTKHKTPRINLRVNGRCLYPMSRVALPACYRPSFVNESISASSLEKNKHCIWPETPHTDCRVWEKRD